MKYITGRALTEEEARERFQRAIETNQANSNMGWYIVKSKEDGTFAGIAKLVMVDTGVAEVGYGTFPAFWNKKYATEILVCLIDYARSLPAINTLVATVRPDNEASRRVLIKQGFAWDHVEMEEEGPVEHFKFNLII